MAVKTDDGFMERIKELIHDGDLREALEQLDACNELQSESEYILLKSRVLIKLGHYQTGLEYLKSVERLFQNQKDNPHYLDFLLHMGELYHSLNELEKSRIVLEKAENTIKKRNEMDVQKCILFLNQGILEKKMGNLEESYKCLSKGLELSEKLNLKTLASEFKNHIGLYYFYSGELDKADKYFRESLRIQERYRDDYLTSWTLNSMGVLYRSRGDFEQALRFLNRSLVMREKIGNQIAIASTLNNIGMVYHDLNDLSRALSTYLKGHEISIEMNSEFHEFVFCINIGIIYHRKGSLSSAMAYYMRSYELAKNRGNKLELAGLLNNMGLLYKDRGELKEALDCFNRCIKLKDECGNNHEYARVLHNIGRIKMMSGNYNDALRKYTQSLEMLKVIDNPNEVSDVLFDIINVYVALDEIDRIPAVIQELHQLERKHTENKLIRTRRILADGLLLSNSSRLREKLKAQEIFHNVFFDDDLIDYDLKIFAALNLADLIILELQSTWSSDGLLELESVLERISRLSDNQNSYILLARTLLLRSKLAVIRSNIEEALSLLTETEKIVTKHGLLALAFEISEQLDIILKQKESLEKHSPAMNAQELLKQLVFATSLKRLHIDDCKKKITHQCEIPIVLALLSKENGRIIYTHRFQSAQDVNSELVESFIQTIVHYSRNLLEKNISIGRIEFHEHTLIMVSFDSILISYLFDGSSVMAIERLENLAQMLMAHISIREQICNAGIVLDPHSRGRLADLISELFGSYKVQEMEISCQSFENEIDKRLFEFKSVLHPVRLAILRKLNAQYKCSFGDLRYSIGVSKGSMKYHVETLVKERLIESRYEFIEARPRLVLYLRPEGVKYYENLQSALNVLFTQTI